MARMRVAELIGNALDHWAARAERREIPPGVALAWDEQMQDMFCPSRNWAQGGPIIEREEMSLRHMPGEGWGATAFMKHDTADYLGPTPLIAAMRAYVASQFGEEVIE